MINNPIAVFLKGIIVGGTMLVPGVSGGSMAMILGIYGRLVSSVSSFSRHKKENFLFLLLFSFGGGIGMLLFAKPLQILIHRYPMPMLYFFMGAVAGGNPLIFRQAQIKAFSWSVPLYIGSGMLTLSLLGFLPSGTCGGNPESAGSLLYLAVAGLAAAVALVLPGISVSYLLLLMGLYDKLMAALGSLSLSFLLPLGAGLVAGILLTARILERVMTGYPQQTYLIILGFVLGSVAKVFPGIPSGGEAAFCIAAALTGFTAILLFSSKEITSE